MSMLHDENDLLLLASHSKNVSMQITLLDDNYQAIEALAGSIKSCSYNLSSESDMRRTCSLTLVVDKRNIDADFNKRWTDCMVEVQCGIFDIKVQDYRWYRLGRFLMTNGETVFSATSSELKLTLIDLMANISNERGSPMSYQVLFETGRITIRDAFDVVVSKFSKYKQTNICESERLNELIPYDILSNIGDYPFDILRILINLYPHFEMFYDADGVFTVREIPTRIDESCDVTSDIIDPLLISEHRSVNYSNVKNTIEIFGKSLDPIYYAVDCTNEDAVYTINISDSFESLVVGETYGFTASEDSSDGQMLQIQQLSALPICVLTGNNERINISEGEMKKDVPYVVSYDGTSFILQGELQVHVIVQEINAEPSKEFQAAYKEDNACQDVRWVVNPDSPFACSESFIQTDFDAESTWRVDHEMKVILNGGEYSDIYTTQLAFERAEYELWQRSRLQDSITLRMIYIPWLDINDKIEYTSPSSGEKIQLLVQTIEPDFKNWTMTIKGAKFYPVYPW